MKQKRKSAAQNKAEKIAKQWQYNGKIKSDVNGSYTGVPDEQGEKPVQDVDDL